MSVNDYDEILLCSLFEGVGSLIFTFFVCGLIGLMGYLDDVELDFEVLTIRAVIFVSSGTAFIWFAVSYIMYRVSNYITDAVKTRLSAEKNGNDAVFVVGHINPVVTFACCILGQVSAPIAIIYTIAQITGAILASSLLWLLKANNLYQKIGVTFIGEAVSPFQAVAMETILTFMVVFTIMSLKLPVSSESNLSFSEKKNIESDLSLEVIQKMRETLTQDSMTSDRLFRHLIRQQNTNLNIEPQGRQLETLSYAENSVFMTYLNLDDSEQVSHAITICKSLDKYSRGFLDFNSFAKLYIIKETGYDALSSQAEVNATVATLASSASSYKLSPYASDGLNAAIYSSSVIFVANIIGLSISGASLNTARSVGPVIFSELWSFQWIFWIGPYLGAFLAAIFYKYSTNTIFNNGEYKQHLTTGFNLFQSATVNKTV